MIGVGWTSRRRHRRRQLSCWRQLLAPAATPIGAFPQVRAQRHQQDAAGAAPPMPPADLRVPRALPDLPPLLKPPLADFGSCGGEGVGAIQIALGGCR
jgi:hypothetical protein